MLTADEPLAKAIADTEAEIVAQVAQDTAAAIPPNIDISYLPK